MTATQAIGALATGVGFIYATDPVSGSIVRAVPNTISGYGAMRGMGTALAPVAGENQAIATIDITAVVGVGLQLTVLTINGVSQITAPVNMTNGDISASAASVVAAINATVPGVGPNYYAESYNGLVYVICPLGFGDTVNGDVLVATFDPGVTYTTTDVNGGSDNKTQYDPKIGLRFWVNPTSGATVNNPAGATEITQYMIMQGLQGALYRETLTSPSANKFSVTRTSAVMHLELNPGAALYDVQEIVGDGFQQGDILYLHGMNAANSVVFKSVAGGTDNIRLVSGADYTSESADDCLVLRWYDDDTNGLGWYEISRGRAVPATPAEMRAIGIPFSPTGVTSLVIAGAVVQTYDPAVDAHTILVTTAAPVVLGGGVSISGVGAPLDGDTWYVSGRGSAIDLNGQPMTVFGVSIPEELAALGNWAVIAVWDGAAYNGVLIPDFQGGQIVDGSHLVDGSVDASTKVTALSVTGAEIANATIATGKFVAETILGGPGGDIAAATITSYNLAASLAASLGCVYCRKTTLLAADILQLFTTPVTLVPAQGAGTYIIPLSTTWFFQFGTAAYVLAGVGGDIFIPTATNPWTTGGPWTFGIDGLVDLWEIFTSPGVTDFTASNQPLQIQMGVGDPTLGDGTLTVWVLYRVLTP